MVVEGFLWKARLWKSKGGELGRRWAAVCPRMGATRTFVEYCRAFFDDEEVRVCREGILGGGMFGCWSGDVGKLVMVFCKGQRMRVRRVAKMSLEDWTEGR